MPRLHYRDPGTGNWVPLGTQGPPGPSAVSADAGNSAVLGSDDLIFVPPIVPTVPDEVLIQYDAPTPVTGLDLWVDPDATLAGIDHGSLSGLADDDHPQYLSAARGDARYHTKAEGGTLYVAKAGSTMSGALILSGDPATDLQAAPKRYVEGRVSKAGDTMTGPLVLTGDPASALHAAPKQYVDGKVAKTGDIMTGQLTAPKFVASDPDPKVVLNIPGVAASTVRQTATGLEIRNWNDTADEPLSVGAPTGPRHAVTKGYVDAHATPKVSVAAPISPAAGDVWIKGVANRVVDGWKTTAAQWRLNFGLGYATATFSAVAEGARLVGTTSKSLARAAYRATPFTPGDLVCIEFDVQSITGQVRVSQAYETSGPWSSGAGAQTVSLLTSHTTQEYGLELDANSAATVTDIRIYNLTVEQAAVYLRTASGWAPVTNPVPAVPGRNRIINGDFSVNQRAAGSVTTGGYGFDRWKFWGTAVQGTSTHTVQVATVGTLPESARNYARMASTGQTDPSSSCLLRQHIEDVRTLSGKTVTVSFWAKAVSGTPSVAVGMIQMFGSGGSADVIIPGAKVAIDSVSFKRYSVTLAVPSISGKTIGTGTDSSLVADLWTSAGTSFNVYTGSLGIQNATIDIWGVQVEEGSVATPFEQKSYADELRACMRYFEARSIAINGGNDLLGVVYANGAVAVAPVRWAVTMRAIPTVTYPINGTARFVCPIDTAANKTIAAANRSTTGAVLTTTGTFASACAGWFDNFSMAIDAEL